MCLIYVLELCELCTIINIRRSLKTTCGNVGGTGIQTITTRGRTFIRRPMPAVPRRKTPSGRPIIGTCVASCSIVSRNVSRRYGSNSDSPEEGDASGVHSEQSSPQQMMLGAFESEPTASE